MGFWNNPKKQNTLFWVLVAMVALIIFLLAR